MSKVWISIILVLGLMVANAPGDQSESNCRCVATNQTPVPSEPNLTVWLMPSEPKANDSSAVGVAAIEQEVEFFNQQFGPQCPVTVLNTTEPPLRAQLPAWNQEFAGPLWPIIKGQQQTLDALCRFANVHGVHTNVRFLTWGQTFYEIKGAIEQKGKIAKRQTIPDVFQVGSTWVAYLAAQGALHFQKSQTDGDLSWRDFPGRKYATLKYTTDSRLLFYWKKLPGDEMPFTPDVTNWNTLLTSLAAAPTSTSPMVMPTGMTLNLLLDYLPLVWAGEADFLSPGSSRIDLTSAKATKIPLRLSQGDSHIVFPEMSPEEASQHFAAGSYRAIIMPVHFVLRWKSHFETHLLPSSNQPSYFWNSASAAVLPTSFKGGSDLAVFARTKWPNEAVALRQFLATDPQYTYMLAALGHLPVQRKDSIDVLLEALGGQADEGAQSFAASVRSAMQTGREGSHFRSWPTEIESLEVKEAFQRLWRQLAIGNRPAIIQAMQEAQLAVNLRINGTTALWKVISDWWALCASGLSLVLFGGVFWLRRELQNNQKLEELEKERARERALTLEGKVQVETERAEIAETAAKAEAERARAAEAAVEAETKRTKAEKERAEALEQVRKVRGFASAALLVVDAVHNDVRRYIQGSSSLKDAQKSLIVAAGLRGWRRGCDDSNWEKCELESLIWRAILLAIASFESLEHFTEWEEQKPDIRMFLRDRQLLRNAPNASIGDPPFYFEIICPRSIEVTLPFMLEQALICLLQNAIRASYSEETGFSQPISVTYDEASDSLLISNSGPSISSRLCKVINETRDISAFEQEVELLLTGPREDRPGIGLVEAYCIAQQCYGGLTIKPFPPTVTVWLHAKRKELGS